MFYLNFVLMLFLVQRPDFLNSLIFQNENNFENFNNYCLSWAKSLKNIKFLTCNLHLKDEFIKALMLNGLIVSLRERFPTNTSDLGHESNINTDFVMFADSTKGNTIEQCLSAAVTKTELTLQKKLLVCDKSSVMPTYLKSGETLNFLGSANALYLTKEECWVASHNYLLLRKFSHSQDCERGQWLTHLNLLPNKKGQFVRVSTFEQGISMIIHKNKTDPKERYDGIEWRIFYEIAKNLNLSWKITEIKDGDNRWGQSFIPFSEKVVRELEAGIADVGIISLWHNYRFIHQIIDCSFPWAEIYLIFLVPRAREKSVSFVKYFNSFAPYTWISIVTTLTVFPLMAWALNWWNKKQEKDQRQTPSSLSYYFLYTFGSLTSGSHLLGSQYHYPSQRWLVSFWYFFILLITNSYNSRIVSDIMSTPYPTEIDSVQQLVERNFTWGKSSYISNPKIYLNNSNIWQQRFFKKFIIYDKTEEQKLLLSKKFALYGQIMDYHMLILDNPIEEYVIKSLRKMKETIKHNRICLALQKNSPLTPYFNKMILRLDSMGVLKGIKQDIYRKYMKKYYYTIFKGYEKRTDHHTVIQFKMLKEMFYVLLAGWITSLLFFVLELYI